MIKRLFGFLAALTLFGAPPAALAQTSGGFSSGQVLTAAALNSAFSSKQDYPLGATTFTSSSSNCLAVGRAGTTNPALQVDCSTASSATGIKIKAAAAAGGVVVSTLSSGTNENLGIDAKGTGTITLGGTSTGNINLIRSTVITGATEVSSTSSSAFAAGANGSVNPALKIDASTASSATGLSVKSAAAGGGVAVAAISSGSNDELRIDGKGTGVVKIGTVSSGAVIVGHGFTVAGLPTCNSAAKGAREYVTDANASTYSVGAAVTAGSSNVIPVFCNGSAWVAG